MTDRSIDHATCSELLRDHVGGRLDSEQAELVEAHLAGCEDCREELSALEALAVVVEPMTEAERAQMRAGVSAALARPAREVVSLPRRRWASRLLPALGAAAVLLVAGSAILGGLNSGSEDEAAGGDVAAERATGDDGAEEAAEEGDSLQASKDEAITQEADTGVAGAAAAGPEPDPPAPGPSFDADAGRLNASKLKSVGRKGRVFGGLAGSVAARDVADLRSEYTLALSDQGPDADARAQLEACTRGVLEDRDDALPAYGAYATYEGSERVLVLGFAYSAQETGPLDAFFLFVWSRDDRDCSFPIDSIRGRIQP